MGMKTICCEVGNNFRFVFEGTPYIRVFYFLFRLLLYSLPVIRVGKPESLYQVTVLSYIKYSPTAQNLMHKSTIVT